MEALPQAWVSCCVWEGQSRAKVVVGFPTRAVVFRLQRCCASASHGIALRISVSWCLQWTSPAEKSCFSWN